jgi:predicted ATPase/DNA-binding SARP family transcriptional activator
MARLSLHLLGPLQVTLAGEPVTGFESDKVRALLVYLAVEAGRPHRRQALAGLLWPGRPERAARKYVRNALSNLRQAIGDRHAEPPYLLITRETIQFNRASDHWLDVETFTACVAAKDSPRPAGQPREAQNIDRLEEAVALYRAGFLEGFGLKDSAEFEDWSLLVRERLQREVMGAFSRLAEYCEARGAYERASEYGWRQVTLEPWQEEAHQRLMRLLALSGRRATALAQYRTCCRVLREELGIEPSTETTLLYERIKSGELDQQVEKRKLCNLPVPLIPLVGREKELAEIADLLQDPGCRLLTLTGPGGCGKTRLALEAAARQVDAFPHGVHFVSLAALESPAAIVPTLAQTLGFSFFTDARDGGEADPRQQLLEYLRNKCVLLLLDNFEHLLSDARPGKRGGVEIVIDILKTAPGVKTVITSRARLKARGEHLYPVPGMEVPELTVVDGQDLDCVCQFSAVQLYLQSARRVRQDYEPTSEDVRHIVRICQLVEGMPLAILLSAAWMEILSPAEIAAQVCCETRASIDFLKTDWHGVPQRQRGLRAVFDHSWNLLSQREQEALARLSVFRGGFTYEAAQHVAGASLHVLRALVDRSLLQARPARSIPAPFSLPETCTIGRRYELHELLRQYAAEKLEASTLYAKARDRHSAYYAAVLERLDTGLKGPRQQEALAEMRADLENARAAWEWASKRGQVARLDQALDGLCRYYAWRGRHGDGEAACRWAAERLARSMASAGELRTLVRMRTWQSAFTRILGRTECASQLLTQSLELLDRPDLVDQDTREEKAAIQRELGQVAQVSGCHEDARRLYEQSLALYGSLGDGWETANTLARLGAVSWPLSQFDDAKGFYAECLDIRRSAGDRRGIASALLGLSLVVAHAGQPEEGERLAREGIAIHREMGDRVGTTDGLVQLASRVMLLGRFAEACRLLEEAAAIYEDLGMRNAFGTAKHLLAWAQVNLGAYGEAQVLLEIALSEYHKVNDRHGVGMSHLGLGEIALANGDCAASWELSEKSAAILAEVGQREEEGLALCSLALAARGLSRITQAQDFVHQALRLAADTGALPTMLFAASVCALLLADAGTEERAVELYALVTRHPYFGDSCFHKDIVGKRIAAAACDLPAEVVGAAQGRGRARDLCATVLELLEEARSWTEG